MQAKTMIIIALVLMGALVIFNVVISNNTPEPASVETTTSDVSNSNANINTNSTNSDDNIADKPLGQQPKSILDKANNEIDKAQQLENEKMAEIENIQ